VSMPKNPGIDEFIKATVANGVRATDFVQAVAWSDRPEVTAALARMLDRTDDPDIFTACFPKGAAPEAATSKLIKLIDALPADDPGPYGKTYHLLVSLAGQPPEVAKPVFVRMAGGSLSQRRSACMALKEARAAFGVEVLVPLLDDQQPCQGWTYPEIEGQNQPRHPIRVCDEAATAMTSIDPALGFKMVGTHADLDAEIQRIRETLAAHQR
jgi:hypothetical protein